MFVLFLTALESTVVSTSLLVISNDLRDFVRRSWVVGAYLVTYTGLLTAYATFARVMGCRFTILTAITLFTAFSIGCGFAQDMITL